MSTDHGFVIYHHWSVLSCKNTIRLPLVLSSSLPHRPKCQVQHKNTSVQSPQDSDSASEKTVVAEVSGFVSSVSSGFDLWEFHTFAFGILFVLSCCSLCHAGHTLPPRPLSFLLSPTDCLHWLQSYLADSATDCAEPGPCWPGSAELPAKTVFHLNRWETRQWISHETNSNFACWMGLSRGGCIVGAAYPLPAPHIRLIISRAA